MLRVFSLTSTGVSGMTLAGASTMNFINPPAVGGVNLQFLRHWCGQVANVNSAQQPVALATQVSTFPTLVSATPRRNGLNDPNASVIVGGAAGAAGTCGIAATAEGAGAKSLWIPDAFNVVNGWLRVGTPEEREVISSGSSSGVSFYLPVAPVTLNGWIWGQSYLEQ